MDPRFAASSVPACQLLSYVSHLPVMGTDNGVCGSAARQCAGLLTVFMCQRQHACLDAEQLAELTAQATTLYATRIYNKVC